MKRLHLRFSIAALLTASLTVSAQDTVNHWEDTYYKVLAQNEQRALSMLQDRYNALSPGVEKLYISSKIHAFMVLRGQPYYGNKLTHNPAYSELEQNFIGALNQEDQLDFESAKTVYRSLLKHYVAENDAEGEALIEYHLCRVLNRQGKFSKASLYCSSLHEHLQNNTFSILPHYRALHVIGNNYDFTGDYRKALEVYKEYLSTIPEHVDPSGVYNDASLLLSGLGNFKLGKEYLNIAIELRTQSNSQLELAQSHYNMGELLLTEGDFYGAIEHFQKTENIVEKFHYLYGLTYAQLGLGKTYVELEQFDEGSKYLLKALETASIQGNDQIRGEIYLSLAKAHQKQRKYILAEDFANNAKKLADRINSDPLRGLSLKSLAEIAEAQENYQQALNYYQSYVDIELSKRDKRHQSASLALDAERQKYITDLQYRDMATKGVEQAEKIDWLTFINRILAMTTISLITLLLASYYSRYKTKQLAEMDLLTGAWARAPAIQNIKKLPRISKENLNYLVILFDLDNLKQINDNHGHPTGDAVLSEIAKTVKDYISTKDIFGRLGGEEFVIVMKNIDELDVQHKVEALHQAISQITLETVESKKLTISASFSYLNTSKSLADFDVLYSILDQALYQVKQNGKNQIIDAFNAPVTLSTTAYAQAQT